MALYTHHGRLHPKPPFDFDTSLDFLGWFVPMLGEQGLGERVLTKAIMHEGQTIVFRVRSAGTIEASELAYTLISAESISGAAAVAAADRISFFLSIDDDLVPFYTLAEGDSAFEPLLKQLYGYHHVKFLSPFEAACWAVLTQRNTGTSSRKMKGAIAERYGGQLEFDGTVYRAFPEAEALISVPVGELAATIGHAPKAAFLSTVIEAFSRVDERWLRIAPYSEVERWLRDINGIGAWSAGLILLRGLGRMEQLPVDDTRITQAVGKAYNAGEPVDTATLKRLAERYGPWRGYWAHYLRVVM